MWYYKLLWVEYQHIVCQDNLGLCQPWMEGLYENRKIRYRILMKIWLKGRGRFKSTSVENKKPTIGHLISITTSVLLPILCMLFSFTFIGHSLHMLDCIFANVLHICIIFSFSLTLNIFIHFSCSSINVEMSNKFEAESSKNEGKNSMTERKRKWYMYVRHWQKG